MCSYTLLPLFDIINFIRGIKSLFGAALAAAHMVMLMTGKDSGDGERDTDEKRVNKERQGR